MNKKGVSPLIATVLLITLVVILIASIILWVKGFVQERISKEGALAEAESKCTQIAMDIKNIQISPGDNTKLIVEITNSGSEDISALVLRIEDASGNVNLKTINSKIKPFETFSQTITEVNTVSGDKVTIIPHVKPEGTGAPLIPCSGDVVKKVTLK